MQKQAQKKPDGFAARFYHSYAWQRCRRAYFRKAGGLCERCLARGIITPGDEVHHVQPLTPENVSDPAVALNFENLQLLCEKCHHELHDSPTRWRTDADGRVLF